MSSPSFIATSTILPFSAVKTTGMGQASPATSSSDSIIGVTGPSITLQGSKVSFQSPSNGMFELVAGSQITTGNIVCPSSNGSFVASGSSGEFISIENSVPGKTFIAMKTMKMNASQMLTLFNPGNASTPYAYPYNALGFTYGSGLASSSGLASNCVTSVSNPCSFDYDIAACVGFTAACGITDSSVYKTGETEHALPGMKPSFQDYETVQVQLADNVVAGDKLMRKFDANGKMSLYPVDPKDLQGDENRPYIAVALQSGSANDVIWAILGGSFRHRAS